MKAYIHYFMTLLVLAGSSRLAIGQADKPTVKVGVFYTFQAANSMSNLDFLVTGAMRNHITYKINTLTDLMATNGLNTDYDVALTASVLLPVYVEPKHRPRKGGDAVYGTDEYVSISGDGTEQVLQEMTLHESFNNYYTSGEDDTDDVPGTLDDDLNVDALDEDEVDIVFLNTIESVKPDVIIVVVDEEGDPLVTDGTIEDVAAGYDDPLYAVMSADYFFGDDESLAYAFFRLFCDPGYSDADLNSDAPNTYSFLSDYWTGTEGTDLLSPTNKELFKHNIGKLKLATDAPGQVVFNDPSDITFQYSGTVQDVGDNASIVFDGTANSFAVAIPEAVYTNEGNPPLPGFYGGIVRIVNSYKVFAAGEFTADSPAAPDPRSDNTPSTTPYVPPAMEPPIDFDNDITAAKKNRYVSDYFGADSKVTNGTGANKDYLTVTKYDGAAYACAETVISFVDKLSLSPTKKKLSVDIKLGTNATATDSMRVILYAKDGSTLTKKIELKGATNGAFKTFDVEFNPTATKTYTRIAIRFNDCKKNPSKVLRPKFKRFLVDNIGGQKVEPDLRFTGPKVSDNRPCIGDDIEFTIPIISDGGSALGVKVNALLLPVNYLVDPINSTATKGTYNPATGDWLIGDMNENETAELKITAKVLNKSTSAPNFQINSDSDSNLDNNTFSFIIQPKEGSYTNYSPTFYLNNATNIATINFSMKNEGVCDTDIITLTIEIDDDVAINPKLTIPSLSINENPPSSIDGKYKKWEIPNLPVDAERDFNVKMTYLGENTPGKVYTINISSPNNPTNVNDALAYYCFLYNDSGTCNYPPSMKFNRVTNSGDLESGKSYPASYLKIYPNPFTNEFRINYVKEAGVTGVTLRVADLTGRVVITQRFEADESQAWQELVVDGAHLPNGAYTYELDMGKGKYQRGKLLKE